MKPVLGVAATGVVAFLVWKVVMLALLPLIGIAVGFVFLVVKIVFWCLVICLAIWVFRRMGRREAQAA